MHIPRLNQRTNRGALMAAALMLMIVGGIFMAGWVTLMNTRSAQVSYLEDVSRRRTNLESARLLGWQFMEKGAFERNTTVAPDQTTTFGTAQARFNTYEGWSNLNVYTSGNTAGGMLTVFPFNATGLRPGASYVTVQRLIRAGNEGNDNFADIDDYNGWQFLKTMPPVLNGDIFSIYRKPDGATTQLDVYGDVITSTGGHHANWTVEGRTVVRHPPSFFVSNTPSPLQLPFRTKSLYIQSQGAAEAPSISHPVYGTAMDGTPLLPSNLPAVPSTTGPIGGTGDLKHYGYLKVVRNDANPDNSLWHFQDREAAAGRTATITIDNNATFNSATEAYWTAEQTNPTHLPPDWPKGYPGPLNVLFIKLDSQYLKNMRIYGAVDQIVFVGQSNAAAFTNAAAMKPVIITVMPATNKKGVRSIIFERENNRRHVLAFQNTLSIQDRPPEVEFTWVNNPISGTQFRWRSVLVNEFNSMIFKMPPDLRYSVRWIGGVMTNWSIKRHVSGGTNPSRLIFSGDNDSTVPAAINAGPAFATFLPRDAWLESYFVPVPPPRSR